jgi:hypothetical protein
MALVAFQLHATLIFFALKAVQLPAMHALGWNTHTIHGLGRFLTLILGAIWLFCVSLFQDYLRDALRKKRVKNSLTRLLIVLGSIYLLCVALLFIFS